MPKAVRRVRGIERYVQIAAFQNTQNRCDARRLAAKQQSDWLTWRTKARKNRSGNLIGGEVKPSIGDDVCSALYRNPLGKSVLQYFRTVSVLTSPHLRPGTRQRSLKGGSTYPGSP